MNLKEFEKEFKKLGKEYKTKDVDKFNKILIKNNIDVCFLKDIILSKQQYHRTYFQVSLGLLKTNEEKFKFIEDNFKLLCSDTINLNIFNLSLKQIKSFLL